jgi:hypothetical protein
MRKGLHTFKAFISFNSGRATDQEVKWILNRATEADRRVIQLHASQLRGVYERLRTSASVFSLVLMPSHEHVVVTTDGVWIGNWIYWTLTLVSTINYDSLTELHTPNITVTTAHKVFSGFTSRCLVAASNGGISPSSGFPNCPRASATSFSLLTTATLNRLNCHEWELLYDWRFTVNQFVLTPSPTTITTTDLFFNWALAVIVLT